MRLMRDFSRGIWTSPFKHREYMIHRFDEPTSFQITLSFDGDIFIVFITIIIILLSSHPGRENVVGAVCEWDRLVEATATGYNNNITTHTIIHMTGRLQVLQLLYVMYYCCVSKTTRLPRITAVPVIIL